MQTSAIHSHLFGRHMDAPLVISAQDVKDYAQLALIGVSLPDKVVRKMADWAMDAAPDLAPLVGTANGGTPIQFLQAWLPGFIAIITAARKIDEIVGMATVGSWEDEEIVQAVWEPTGLAQPYGDRNNIPLASYNVNYERRSIVRFEQGMSVGKLESLRAARQRVSAADTKRKGSTLSLEIQRNRIGFYGFNTGLGRTYGFLNDPNAPAYSNFPNGASGSPLWSTKTFQEITADIRTTMAALRVQAQGNIDPRTAPITWALSENSAEYLNVTTDFGVSVIDWAKKNYPNTRFVDAPELNAANGGANVCIIFVDSITDGASDDGGEVWMQMVPTKFMPLGVEQRAKSYVEDYTNATAGTLLKRPYAVIRRSGN